MREVQGQRRRRFRVAEKLTVELDHEGRGGRVVHFPKRRHHAPRAGSKEGIAETGDALMACGAADASFAGTQGDQFGGETAHGNFVETPEAIDGFTLTVPQSERQSGMVGAVVIDESVGADMQESGPWREGGGRIVCGFETVQKAGPARTHRAQGDAFLSGVG